MDNLIERYIYDVIRRLPEKDRDEVSKELKSNIYDMLPDSAGENEIRSVLYELGSPALLAEKYRQKPRYLISPSIYDDYVRALKWILPMVGGIALVIGMILGIIDVIQYYSRDLSYFSYMISKVLSKGISLGLSAIFQALFWTTAGFVIAERTSVKAGKNREREWKIEDLPEMPHINKNRIPLSDSITELAVTVVFSAAAILLCLGIFPVAFMIQSGDIQVQSLFSPEFLAGCIPAIVIMAIFGILECIAKIKHRQWAPLVCGAVIVSNIVSMVILVYLINRPDLFSTEFAAFVRGFEWGSFDLLRFVGTGEINPVIVFISLIIVVCSLTECIKAIYKTFRGEERHGGRSLR
ncbi:hypothetical protein DFR58_10364 [Anaerobacterium chartisolvens]|uniref:Uncharacterized protein n=1 Tax=Anaerobacterium chartisolvens TaxID=1297424 RepID=A0A369BCQ3_9FIRM|nr:hypothetical protein [Anaerobacterium chartisolvens]RCX19319.1 hypothetical protein DFR58_10364 [Anaerobacterium chartisolvens]